MNPTTDPVGYVARDKTTGEILRPSKLRISVWSTPARLIAQSRKWIRPDLNQGWRQETRDEVLARIDICPVFVGDPT